MCVTRCISILRAVAGHSHFSPSLQLIHWMVVSIILDVVLGSNFNLGELQTEIYEYSISKKLERLNGGMIMVFNS